MRVLIVSEGEHELGKEGVKGALQTLVERVLGEEIECERWTVRHERLVRVHGKGGGMFKKAVSCMLNAAKDGYDAVVLVVDEDGDRSRRKQFEDAQAYLGSSIPRAMGLAIRTFDAWMLADEVALNKVLGGMIATQPDPEANEDAKERCRELREEYGCELGMWEFYSAVMQQVRLEVLEERCKEGFGVFARRVREM
jgi:hypothetical protein